MDAIKVLLEGRAKDNEASLQRHFDERDQIFEQLQSEDLNSSAAEGDEWVAVKVVQESKQA